MFRTYLKTILDNPESRKIFQFLLLNLAYMLVQVRRPSLHFHPFTCDALSFFPRLTPVKRHPTQMVWGITTNSLGLISDGMSSPSSPISLKIDPHPYLYYDLSNSHVLRLYGTRSWSLCLSNGYLEAQRVLHLWVRVSFLPPLRLCSRLWLPNEARSHTLSCVLDTAESKLSPGSQTASFLSSSRSLSCSRQFSECSFFSPSPSLPSVHVCVSCPLS